jgi:phage gp37-like protein
MSLLIHDSDRPHVGTEKYVAATHHRAREKPELDSRSVGLQVQEWAEEQDRRELETTYTTRLHDEVVNLQATRSPLTAQRHRLLDSLKTATALLFGTVDRSLTTEECQGISFSYVVSNPTDDLASLIELQSSAGLSQFRNENVLAALRAFLLQRARFRDSRAGIAETVIELPSAYPELIRVVSPSSVSESPTPGTFECDVEEMRRSSGFMNDYELNQANFAFHVQTKVSPIYIAFSTKCCNSTTRTKTGRWHVVAERPLLVQLQPLEPTIAQCRVPDAKRSKPPPKVSSPQERSFRWPEIG